MKFKHTKNIRFNMENHRSKFCEVLTCTCVSWLYQSGVLKNVKPYSKSKLPDLKGSLSIEIPSTTIAQANQEVQQTLANHSAKSKKKQGSEIFNASVHVDQ